MHRWDNRMSTVTPNEDVFYKLGLLHTSEPRASKKYDELNNEILRLCENAGIKVKQYLPYFNSRKDWIEHFGSKWKTFQKNKTKFDPKMILAPGQRIFHWN